MVYIEEPALKGRADIPMYEIRTDLQIKSSKWREVSQCNYIPGLTLSGQAKKNIPMLQDEQRDVPIYLVCYNWLYILSIMAVASALVAVA